MSNTGAGPFIDHQIKLKNIEKHTSLMFELFTLSSVNKNHDKQKWADFIRLTFTINQEK